MTEKAIVTATVTGAQSKKENSPSVPLTLSEIVEDTHECQKAGAAVAYLHVRDDTGNGTMNKEKFRETLELLKLKHPGCNTILNLTTSGDLAATNEARQVHLEELRPGMTSYDCGSANRLNSSLFINSPKFLEELGNNVQKWGMKPEIEVFDPGMIANAAYYLKEGVLRAPLHSQLCMRCANDIPGTMKDLAFMKKMMESPCPSSTWGCFSVGCCITEMLYGTVAMDGHIRMGMEDNVLHRKRQLIDSSAKFVDRAVQIIRKFGSQPATPDGARQLLELIKG